MPSVRYFNQTAPFWDFIASMEEQGASHPFLGGSNRGEAVENENNERPNTWTEGWSGVPWGGVPWGPFAHRGRHGHHGPHPPPPPPPPQSPPPQLDGSGPLPPPEEGEGESEPEGGPSDDPYQGPRGRRGHHGHHGRHHPFGRGGRHGMGPRGPHGRGRGRPYPHPYGFGPFGSMADLFHNQFFGTDNNTTTRSNNNNEDFSPEVDVFDAPEAFVVHVSLAGAKKEDVAVSWDADKSELSISGVVHRPGDEELLKTIALDERKVGAFERKVRLGSRANPAQVDVDGIAAKMEDGVLRIEVPKLDAGYVEVKKVDII